jgi:hypothetical protein
MAARWPSGCDFGAHARHCVGVRPLLCRHHGCELEIPLYHTHRFLNRDYIMFDCGGVALSEDKLNFSWEATGPILGESSAILKLLVFWP